ncbi:acetylcholinesterase-like isoform X2 [Gordionus sp. m RMFG-2023]|uniref:acetylcholinesterase-like isoform X2 n=1 Tax=Gordionus sp. m RMFG-2023 TaxID=3053472 RepID=UPI0031FD21A9
MWNANTYLSEDCLYLNLWVPHDQNLNYRNNLLPIIVWIYGGGYYSGTITLPLYDGSIMASKMRVIVMSMNYRLGSLGYLYLGNKEAPGNQGLWDQLLAMKWMKANSKNFGGDPNKITLMGESAGASSVAFHLLSPLSKDYFNYAVLQSASATSPWALVNPQEAIHRGLLLADSMKCPYKTRDKIFAILDCLRNFNHSIILEREFVTNKVMQFSFVPVVDGKFLVSHPRRLLDAGLFKRTPILLGTNLNEGTSFSIYYLDKMFQPLRKDVSYLTTADISTAAKDIYWHLNPIAQDAVYFHYNDWENLNHTDALQAIDRMAGDFWFTCNVNEFASIYAFEGSPVYMYQFAHRSSQNPWPIWMGVMHGDEISYVFGEPFKKDGDFLEEERDLSRRMMRYWTNFAATGNPNISPDDGFVDIKWPLYTAYQKNFLKLTMNMSITTNHVHNGPSMKSCAFQKLYLPQFNQEIENLKKQPCLVKSPNSTSLLQKSPILIILCLIFIHQIFYIT